MTRDDRPAAPGRRRPNPILIAVLALLALFVLWFIGDTVLWNTAETPADPGANVMPAQPGATTGMGEGSAVPADPNNAARDASGDAVRDGLGVTGAEADPNS